MVSFILFAACRTAGKIVRIIDDKNLSAVNGATFEYELRSRRYPPLRETTQSIKLTIHIHIGSCKVIATHPEDRARGSYGLQDCPAGPDAVLGPSYRNYGN